MRLAVPGRTCSVLPATFDPASLSGITGTEAPPRRGVDELKNRFGLCATGTRMGRKRYAVRSAQQMNIGHRRSVRLDDVELAEHRGRKTVGGAPCSMRNSAIGRFPTCDADPSAVSQSPKPQSHDAFASEGWAVTSSFTRARSRARHRRFPSRDAGAGSGNDSSRQAGSAAARATPAPAGCCLRPAAERTTSQKHRGRERSEQIDGG